MHKLENIISQNKKINKVIFNNERNEYVVKVCNICLSDNDTSSIICCENQHFVHKECLCGFILSTQSTHTSNAVQLINGRNIYTNMVSRGEITQGNANELIQSSSSYMVPLVCPGNNNPGEPCLFTLYKCNC